MKKTFKVSGMHCPSCEKVLQMDIGEIAGVKSVKANYKAGTVDVNGEGFDESAVKKAMVQNGYKV
ncbi:TPA: heavy-metal-associated domain-containing protein [Candidatus Micrarchaeota archaeon]|nr:heavy-metal-associated domain-containing protein [Candidatus Micrarchaeota archaeon]